MEAIRMTCMSDQLKKKSPWMKLLIVMILLFVALAVVVTVITKRFISEDYIAEKIEESINSDVEIGGLDFAVFNSPANLTLKNVSFTPKSGGDAPIRVKEISLSVGLMDLLKKHIDLSSIIIRGAKVSVTFREDGSNSLEELFEDADLAERSKKKKSPAPKKTVPDAPVAIEEGSGFNAFDQADFVATLGRFKVEDSQFDIILEEMELQLHCTDVNLDLSSIKIDPKKLYETNSANLTASLSIGIDSMKDGHYGDLHLSGASKTTIFNPETGEVEPNVMGDVSLSDESWLNTRVPVVAEAWEKLSVLEKIGVNVSELPEKAVFGRSKSIAVHYHLGKFTVLKPISIWVGDWEIAALAQSWIQTQTDEHMIQAELLASEKSSRRFYELIEKGMKQLPAKVSKKVTQDIRSQLLRDNRILVAVQSSGDFSKPKVRPTGKVVDYTGALKDAGQDYLEDKAEDLLKGLLKKL